MEQLPFIHTIKTPLGYYFYDVNTNQIIQIDEKVYNYLLGTNKNLDSICDIEKKIDKLKKAGYLSNNRPSKMIHSADRSLEFRLNENIEQVTLQVTQQCNFRCSYCIYGGNTNLQRHHTNQCMSYDVAKSIIDFYVKHSIGQDTIFVAFYGGEPLLEFDLIKRVVNYSEKVFEGKDLTFAITTNGSLLNDENVDFMSKHNFEIIVSLDGTPEIHDRARKFAQTGEGTFGAIEKNLKKIRKNNPDFYRKIKFNIVIDPRNEIDALHEMVTNDEIFRGAYIRAILVDDRFTDEKTLFSNKFAIEDQIRQFKALLSYLGRYPDNKVSIISKNSLNDMIGKYKSFMTNQQQLSETMAPGGPCVPGQKRLFVNTNGEFFPCERVSETSDAMKIGNIKDGFDYNKARKILNIAQLTENACKNCWAMRYCTICVKSCDNNGELSGELKLIQCKIVINSTDEIFKDNIMLNEIKQLLKTSQ